jgi:hypothetical protein
MKTSKVTNKNPLRAIGEDCASFLAKNLYEFLVMIFGFFF